MGSGADRGGFKLTEHTGEVGIEAWGPSLAEVFSQSALGLLSVMVDPESVKERLSVPVEVDATDLSALLVSMLNELVYRFDVEGFLVCRLQVEEMDQHQLKAVGHGERFSEEKHIFKIGVKAATYYTADVYQQGGCWRATVVLDI